MPELCHNIDSACAQQFRIAMKEKGQEAAVHILTLRGDQTGPRISNSIPMASCRR